MLRASEFSLISDVKITVPHHSPKCFVKLSEFFARPRVGLVRALVTMSPF